MNTYRVAISCYYCCSFLLLLLSLPLVAQCYTMFNYDTHDLSYPEGQDPSHDPTITEPSPMYAPPTDIEFVRINDTSVVLRWEIAYSAHAQLQFFKLQYKPTKKESSAWRTDSREIPATTRAYQVNGLRPGNYFFIISAVYDNDDNIPSEQVKYKLRAGKNIPSSEWPEMKAPIIHWSEAKQDYIRFKWIYKFKDADINYYGYLVYYRSAHAVTDFTIYNTLDENVELAELELDTPYEAKVVAYNQHTVSEFSSLVTVRTTNTSSSKPSLTTTTTIPTTPLPPTTTTVTSSSSTTTTTTTTTTTRRPSSMTTTVSPKNPINEEVSMFTTITNFYEYLKEKNREYNMRSPAIPSPEVVLVPFFSILVIGLFIASCIISCRNKASSSSSSSSVQSSDISDTKFDFEINFFTNSFPGVEKLNNVEIKDENFLT